MANPTNEDISENKTSSSSSEIGLKVLTRPIPHRFVNVGEIITKAEGYVRGHCVRAEKGNYISCVAGFVEQTDKLVFVRPMRSRYTPQVGHVVVGRITRVMEAYWSVDIGSIRDVNLPLSGIHLPGDVHRRRSTSDISQMHMLLKENDLISAEVQSLRMDGEIKLHTRNLKYGKLNNGMFIKVDQSLIKQSSQHFINLDYYISIMKNPPLPAILTSSSSSSTSTSTSTSTPIPMEYTHETDNNNNNKWNIGVDIVLGNNGFIWITNSIKNENLIRTIYEYKEKHLDYTPLLPKIDTKIRWNMVRVRNCIECLNQMYLHICPESIVDVYFSSIHLNFTCTDILKTKQNMYQCVQNVLFRM